jgi:hypothetical protein
LITHIRVWLETKLGQEQVLWWKQSQEGRTVLFVASKRFVRITYTEDDFFENSLCDSHGNMAKKVMSGQSKKVNGEW